MSLVQGSVEGGLLPGPQVMQTVAYRGAARTAAVVEVIFSCVVFVAVLILVTLLPKQDLDKSLNPEVDSYEDVVDTEVVMMDANKIALRWLVIFLGLSLVVMLVQLGFSACIFLATSKTSVS